MLRSGAPHAGLAIPGRVRAEDAGQSCRNSWRTPCPCFGTGSVHVRNKEGGLLSPVFTDHDEMTGIRFQDGVETDGLRLGLHFELSIDAKVQLGIKLAARIQSDRHPGQTRLELANHRLYFPAKTVLLMRIAKAHRREIRQSKHQQ